MKDIQEKYYQHPSDFKPPKSIRDIQLIFDAYSFNDGRVLTGFKWEYAREHSDDLIVFNANVLMPGYGKVWYGDLNLTEDYKILKKIATSLHTILYVLWEMDARFGKEMKSIDKLLKKAVWNTDEDKPTIDWYLKKNGV